MNRAGALMVVVLLAVSLHAQQMRQGQMGEPGQEHGSPMFFYEANNLVDADTAKSRVDIPYRIDSQFFIAVRNTDASFPFPFKKRGEMLIELIDENGISKAREINRFEIGAATTESNTEEKNWYQGIASFSVQPGKYTIVFEVDDLESERKSLERNRSVVAKQFTSGTFESSTPVFVRQSGDELTLSNFGGNLAFGEEASLYVELHSDSLTSDPVRVEYSISTENFLFEDPVSVVTDTIPALPLLQNFWPEVNKTENSPPSYSLVAKDNTHTAAIIVSFHAEKLPLRPFVLNMKVTQGKSELTIKKPFRMVWPQMPMSLKDIDFALDVLKYITTEDELDSLRSGSRDMRLKHLEEFWKAKDRTPGTAYNEVMVEYYRRVDYAQRTFSSMKGPDGYKTDRGRIYILHGPPAKNERSLDPSLGFQEVWTYDNPYKQFVFRDQSKSGNYTLVATQNR